MIETLQHMLREFTRGWHDGWRLMAELLFVAVVGVVGWLIGVGAIEGLRWLVEHAQ